MNELGTVVTRADTENGCLKEYFTLIMLDSGMLVIKIDRLCLIKGKKATEEIYLRTWKGCAVTYSTFTVSVDVISDALKTLLGGLIPPVKD